MQYLLMLAGDPDAPTTTPGSGDGVLDDWTAYTRALEAAGVLVGGAALHGPGSATAVRVRGGERLLTDGPFVEAKEHLLGYYVIEAPDLDTAIGWAARAPIVRSGTVEVRPVIPGSTTADTLARAATDPVR